MRASEAAALTQAADINAIAQRRAVRKYAEIMGAVEGRAKEGFGTLFAWICDDDDTYMGRAVRAAVVGRLEDDGYRIKSDECGRHYITWASDNHGHGPVARIVRRPIARIKALLAA